MPYGSGVTSSNLALYLDMFVNGSSKRLVVLFGLSMTNDYWICYRWSKLSKYVSIELTKKYAVSQCAVWVVIDE